MPEEELEPVYQYVMPPEGTADPARFLVNFDRVTPPGPTPDSRISITVSAGTLERIQTGDLNKPLSRSRVLSLGAAVPELETTPRPGLLGAAIVEREKPSGSAPGAAVPEEQPPP